MLWSGQFCHEPKELCDFQIPSLCGFRRFADIPSFYKEKGENFYEIFQGITGYIGCNPDNW